MDNINPDNIYCPNLRTGFGAIRSFSSGVKAVTQLPLDFKINQNFPNPFNAETMIPLELPERSEIKIELYNIQGQRVETVYRGIQNAGWPKIRYNASALASGIYFLRIEATGLEKGGKFSDISKIVLVK